MGYAAKSSTDQTTERHEAHSYSLTCVVCGQYFNRMDSLARHRAQHERPEAKQRPPMKRPAAPEAGPIPKQRRTVSPPTNTHQEKSRVAADTEVLPDDPETRVLYLRHWNTIRTEEATGNRVQDRHNFSLHEMTESIFTEMVHRSLENRPPLSGSTCRLVLSYDIWKPVNYVTTIPARTTPDC